MMSPLVRAVLDEMEARAEREFALRESIGMAEFVRRNDEFLIYVGSPTGQLLNLLIKESGARSILEIGTAYGYSTIWLAEAARETGGRVTTVETKGFKIDSARDSLARAGLADYVAFRQGDAREIIPSIAGPFDFALIDAWKDVYIPCFDLMRPKLHAGSIIVADNMLAPKQHNASALEYRNHVRATAGMESVLLPVGTGIFISTCGAG